MSHAGDGLVPKCERHLLRCFRVVDSKLRVSPRAAGVSLQDERDNGKNDEDDDQPFGDIHTESGDSSGAEYRRDDREYQKEDCELDETAPELQRHRLDREGAIQHSVGCYHSTSTAPGYVNPRRIHPHPVFDYPGDSL